MLLSPTLQVKVEKAQPSSIEKIKTDMEGNDIVVVDLHADALLETTAGMGSTDILNYQLNVFREKLKEYCRKKGQKIVFIHGKGEGILRNAIINELRYKYKTKQCSRCIISRIWLWCNTSND